MKTVIEMAREIWSAGEVYVGPSEKNLERFAELVRADEREACAKIANGYIGCDPIVDAIRARGIA